MDRLLVGFAQSPGGFAQLAHESAEFVCRGLGRLRHAEGDCHRIGDLFRKLPDEAAFDEAEHAAPDAIQMDRNDRDRTAFHDAFESAAER